jgi:1-acyl-sn-glycerol-3-phosphate acyltransferase
MSQKPPPLPPAESPLWRNLNFVLMWTSTAASGFGDRMIMSSALALLGAFALETPSAGVNSQTQFFFVLPYVLLSVPMGWLADRVMRKWILLACDEARAGLLMLAIALIPMAAAEALLPADHQWKVFALLFAIGCCAASFNPVRNAIVPDLVPRGQLQPANAIILTITVIAAMIGQYIAPMLIDVDARATVRRALLLAMAFYGISGLFFAFLRPLPRHLRSARRERRPPVGGLAYLLRHRSLAMLILVHGAIWGVAAAVYSGVLAVAKLNYGVDGNALFEVFSRIGPALGIGLLGGAILIGVIKTRRESPLVLALALAGAGACVFGFVISPSERVGLPLAFFIGVFGNVAIVASLTLVQSLSPSYVRGRIMGITAVVDNFTILVVHYCIWKLPDADQDIITVLKWAGPGMMVLGLIWAWRFGVTGPMPEGFVNLLWRINRLYTLVWHRVRWVGRHNVPSEGPVILAANHTTGLDPFVMQSGLRRLVRWLMLTEYLFTFATPLWRAVKPIALDKASSDMNKLRLLVSTLKEGNVVGLFPEGSLQRTHRDLQPFRHGIAVIARRAGATIVPVWIHGTPRRHHMIWHFLTPSRTTVIYGRPFRPPPDMPDEEVVTELRERMVALAQQIDPDPA